MRTVRVAAVALAAALAGCGPTTFPWSNGGGSTPGGGGGGGGGSATLVVSPASLAFSATQGGATPAAKGLSVYLQGGSLTTFYMTIGHSGAVASATPDPVSGYVMVSVGAPATAGQLTGAVTIHAYADSGRTQELAGSPATVAVTYTITNPGSFSVSPASLSFSANQGDPAPPSQDLTVTTQPGSSGAVYLSVSTSGIAGATAVLDTTATPALVHVTMPAPGSASASGHVYVQAWDDAAHTRPLPGSPADVPLAYNVATSQFAAAPTTLTFTTPAGATPQPQTIGLSDSLGTASWTSSVTYISGTGWLTVSPSSGAALPATATVSVTPPAYQGSYTASVSFSARGVTHVVGITLQVTSPRVVAAPASLAFSSVSGQTSPIATQPLALTLDSGATVSYGTAITYGAGASGWLSVAPATGSTPGSLAVGVTGPALPVGHYTATLTVSGPYGTTAAAVPITCDVAAPALSVQGGSLIFGVDQYTTLAQASQPFLLLDSGTPIAWTATVTAPWLSISPLSGTTGTTYPTASLVLPELETISQGAHTTTVVVTYVAASGATVQVSVPVTLTVNLAYVDYVAPRISVVGYGGDVILRGSGFAYPYPIDFGATPATTASGTTPTQVRATPPTLAAGTYAVTSTNNLGLTRSRASLVVVSPVTRTAASVASAGTKTKAIFDDVRKSLYVANVGAGKVQRHREVASWVLAADGSDEIALTGLQNIALSPDGATILAIAGTSLRTIDAASFQLTSAQPSVQIPSATAHALEFMGDGRAMYVDRPSYGTCWIFDPAAGTSTALYGGKFTTGLAVPADASRVAIFGADVSYPPQNVSYYVANTGGYFTPGAQKDASLGASDRHADRTLLFGCESGTCAGVLYDATLGLIPGGVGTTTTALALSSVGLGRAYTFDGSKLHAWDLAGTLSSAGLFPEVWKPAVSPAASPGANPLLVLSADEKTAFLVGDAGVVVVPLPQ